VLRTRRLKLGWGRTDRPVWLPLRSGRTQYSVSVPRTELAEEGWRESSSDEISERESSSFSWSRFSTRTASPTALEHPCRASCLPGSRLGRQPRRGHPTRPKHRLGREAIGLRRQGFGGGWGPRTGTSMRWLDWSVPRPVPTDLSLGIEYQLSATLRWYWEISPSGHADGQYCDVGAYEQSHHTLGPPRPLDPGRPSPARPGIASQIAYFFRRRGPRRASQARQAHSSVEGEDLASPVLK